MARFDAEAVKRSAIFVALLGAAPLILGFGFELYEEVVDEEMPQTAFLVGFFGGVVFDVLCGLYLILHALNTRFTLIPGESEGDRVSLDYMIDIAKALRQLPDPTSNGDPFVSRVLQGAVKSEIELISDPLTRGEAHFSPTRLASFYGALKENLRPRHRILATCFTDMEDFWAKPEIGAEYLRFNLELIVDNQVPMTRIFGMQSDLTHTSDGLKTELIRLLAAYDPENAHARHTDAVRCSLRVLEHDQGSNLDDLFLILDGERPLLALKWDMDPEVGRLRNVKVVYDKLRLDNYHARFQELQDESDPIDYSNEFRTSRITLGVRDSVKYWARHAESATANQTCYLQSVGGRTSTGDLRKYWENLEGSLIRPAPDGLEQLHLRLEKFAQRPDNELRVLSLGCTPETRAAVAFRLGARAKVDCVDLSSQMFDVMTACVEAWEPQALGLPADTPPEQMETVRALVRANQFEPWNWLSLDQRGFRYDLILGVDALNMVPHDVTADFIEILSNVLKTDGQAMLQAVVTPEDKLQDAICSLVALEDTETAYKEALELMKRNKLTKGDTFSKLALSTLGRQSGQRRVLRVGDVVRDVTRVEKLIEMFGFETAKFSTLYKFCNSELAVRPRELLGNQLATHFEVATPYWRDAADYTGAFCWYWLSPKKRT